MGMGFAPTWFRQVSPLRVVFEAESSGGEVRQVVSPTFPFPVSLPSPFPLPLHPFLISGRERQIQWGGSSPASPLQLPPCPFNHCIQTAQMYRAVCQRQLSFLFKVPVDVDLANSRVKFRTEILSGCWGKQLILEDCHLEDTTIIFNFIILTVVDDHRDIRSINHQHAKHERITKWR